MMDGFYEQWFTTDGESDAQPTLIDALRRITQLEQAVAMLLTPTEDDASPEIEGAKQIVGSVREGVKSVTELAPGHPKPKTNDSLTTDRHRTNDLIAKVQAANRRAYR